MLWCVHLNPVTQVTETNIHCYNVHSKLTALSRSHLLLIIVFYSLMWWPLQFQGTNFETEPGHSYKNLTQLKKKAK